MDNATEHATLRTTIPKLRELWEAHAEHALAPEGSAAKTDAHARRDALFKGLNMDERRVAATLAFTFVAVLDYR